MRSAMSAMRGWRVMGDAPKARAAARRQPERLGTQRDFAATLQEFDHGPAGWQGGDGAALEGGQRADGIGKTADGSEPFQVVQSVRLAQQARQEPGHEPVA